MKRALPLVALGLLVSIGALSYKPVSLFIVLGILIIGAGTVLSRKYRIAFHSFMVLACYGLYLYINDNWHFSPIRREWEMVIDRFSFFGVFIIMLLFFAVIKQKIIFFKQVPEWQESIYFPWIFHGFHYLRLPFFLYAVLLVNLLSFGWRLEVGTIWSLLPFAIGFAFFNSVAEEGIWRGWLFQIWREEYGEKAALVVTSIGFGVQHGLYGFPFWSIPLFTLSGFFYGALALKTKSWLPGLLIHAWINILMVLSGMIV